MRGLNAPLTPLARNASRVRPWTGLDGVAGAWGRRCAAARPWRRCSPRSAARRALQCSNPSPLVFAAGRSGARSAGTGSSPCQVLGRRGPWPARENGCRTVPAGPSGRTPQTSSGHRGHPLSKPAQRCHPKPVEVAALRLPAFTAGRWAEGPAWAGWAGAAPCLRSCHEPVPLASLSFPGQTSCGRCAWRAAAILHSPDWRPPTRATALGPRRLPGRGPDGGPLRLTGLVGPGPPGARLVPVVTNGFQVGSRFGRAPPPSVERPLGWAGGLVGPSARRATRPRGLSRTRSSYEPPGGPGDRRREVQHVWVRHPSGSGHW